LRLACCNTAAKKSLATSWSSSLSRFLAKVDWSKAGSSAFMSRKYLKSRS